MGAAILIMSIVLLSTVGVHNPVNGFPSPAQVAQRPWHYQIHAGVGPSRESPSAGRIELPFILLKRDKRGVYMNHDMELVNSDSEEDFRQFKRSSRRRKPRKNPRDAAREETKNAILKTLKYVNDVYLAPFADFWYPY